MRHIILISSFIISNILSAQDTPVKSSQEMTTGTKFEEISFEQLKAKAKSSGKLIFIDCYTQWCGPCKKMVKETFPVKEVGEYMDSVFVSAKFDCEHGEGIEIRERFGVSSYPTYLILDATGKVINTTGGFHKADAFIELLKKLSAVGVDLENYGNRYIAGDRSKQFIKDYCEMLIGARQYSKVVAILDDLLVKEGFEKFYWPVYATSCFNDYSSEVIKYIVNNKSSVILLVGEEAVNKRLSATYNFPLSKIFCVPKMVFDEAQLNLIQTVRNLNMPKGNELYFYIQAIDMRKSNDYEKLISLYETEICKLPVTRRFSLDRGLFLIADLTPAQLERVKKYAADMFAKEPNGSKYAPSYSVVCNK